MFKSINWWRSKKIDRASKPQRKSLRQLAKIGAVSSAAILIFGSGLAIGRGSLELGKLATTTANHDLPAKLDYSSVNSVYSILKQNFDGQLKKDRLLDGAKDGLVKAAGDPYTDYLNPEEAKEFDESLSGSFSGIGAELGSDNDNIVIIAPLAESPAERAGLRPKDIIAAVNDKSTQGFSIEQTVREIRGAVGTKVKLTVIRNNGAPFELTITRAKIVIPSVKQRIDGNIGYLKINQFNGTTFEAAYEAAQAFRNKNVKGVMLDLRGNPGGFLNGAVDIASLWLEKGKTVVSERRGGKIIKTEQATGTDPLKGIPTIVLIDEGSASASEIVAGALRDHKVATLVGMKSFGKGSIQQLESLPGGSQLKVTIARWYTPAGKNIDKQGINPDVQVITSEADVKAGQDPQQDKALEILQGKISGN